MFTLRPAEQKDAGAIHRMVRQAHINPTGLAWPRFTVAVSDNGRVIGCVQVKPHDDGTRELASLVVLLEWQGKGLARSLVEHVIAVEQGTLYLMCRSGLIPFYTRFGFEALAPAELPPYFLRVYNLFKLFSGAFRRPERLAIMCRVA